MAGDLSAGLTEKFREKQKRAGGADRDENTSESLSLLYCLPSSLSPPLLPQPGALPAAEPRGPGGEEERWVGKRGGQAGPHRVHVPWCPRADTGPAVRSRVCGAPRRCSRQQSPGQPKAPGSPRRREALGCRREEQPHARRPAPFGPGLLSDSSATCLETPPAPDRNGKGARWVSSTSCCTVLRLACLQIHRIIHAKQPFRNHFLCFFETLLYSSICLI